MQRQLYIIAYDISDPPRLRQALATVRPWRATGQKSVAECYLGATERDRLGTSLARIIDPATDRVHMLRLDLRMQPEMFGVAEHYHGQPFLVE